MIAEFEQVELFAEARLEILKELYPLTDPSQANYFVVSQFTLARYEPGGFLRAHADATARVNRFRRISAVLYLNDDYIGGETAFPRLRQSYRGSVGQALLFPSHYIHRGEAVVCGRKYALVFFLCDPNTVPEVF